MPLISVVIPIYNVEKYITRCVESLLSQKYRDCEIILSDDGSTDKSGEIADQLAEKNENVFAYHKTNGGLATARNFGMEKANGKYVVFVDSDDYVVPHYFETIETHLQNNVDIFKFGYQRISNGILGSISTPYYEEGIYSREQIVNDILPGAIGPISLFDYSKTPLLSACTCAYSMLFLKKNRIVFVSEREILHEDHLFNIQALVKAQKVDISHEVLYLYDFREGSLSKRYIKNIVERKTKLLSCYRQFLNNEGMFEKYKMSFYSQCIDSYYACVTNECSGWNNEGVWKTASRIKEILNKELCVEAFSKVKPEHLSKKGLIIYSMMKNKMALAMLLLYRMFKR